MPGESGRWRSPAPHVSPFAPLPAEDLRSSMVGFLCGCVSLGGAHGGGTVWRSWEGPRTDRSDIGMDTRLTSSLDTDQPRSLHRERAEKEGKDRAEMQTMEQPTVGTGVAGSEMEVDATDTSLKRLEFVKDYACWGSKRATDMYQSTKNVAPDMIKPGLDNLECKIGQFAGPLYHKFEPEVPKILNAVDSKVDETILGVWSIYSNRVLPSRPVKMAQGAYTSLLSQSEKQIEFLEQLREEYFKKIENTVDMVRAQGVTPVVKEAGESLLKSVSDARAALPTVSHSVLTERVMQAWTDFKDLGPVKHAIASYEPAVAAAQEKYFAALKTVTKDPRYASLVSSGTGMLQSINTSSTYQKRLAPYLSPYLSKIASSSYYTRLTETLKPTIAAS